MKACENYIDKMLLSLDGALSQQENDQLQEHLSHCEGCRCLYETYRNIDGGLLAMEVEPPEGLCQSVMQKIRQEKEKNRPVYILKRMKFSLTALAACLVLLVAGKLVGAPAVVEDAAAPQVHSAQSRIADAPVAAGDAALIPAHEEAGENEQNIPEDDAMVQGRMAVSEDFSDVLEALNRDGYRGDLVELMDMTQEQIYERFSQVETLLISSGDRVYQVSYEQFDQVQDEMNYGAVVSTDEVGDWVYLWIGD